MVKVRIDEDEDEGNDVTLKENNRPTNDNNQQQLITLESLEEAQQAEVEEKFVGRCWEKKDKFWVKVKYIYHKFQHMILSFFENNIKFFSQASQSLN